MSVKPLLDHRSKLQETIDGGLANARQDAMLWHRAWVLREVLDKIRADIDADYPHRKKSKEDKPEPKKPVVAPELKPKTMWDRLGGEKGVTRIVDDFVNTAVKDPKVDFFRHNKVKLDAEHIVKMKREFVEQISQATGGPLKYKGPDMKKIHRDMGVTNEQFDAAAVDLKKALEKNKVAPEDRKKILDAINSYRKEIVQPKKPDDKKPVEKKPDEKKPDEKKPDEKKPAASVSVSGKVIFKGKPAAGAKISLVSTDGMSFSDTIAAHGTYRLAVKQGEYHVTFSARRSWPCP